MKKRLAECRVTVVGLGLMGASLCLDLSQHTLCREVRGVARRTDTVLDAFFAGAVDLATNDLYTGILGADIVILATPVRTIVHMLEELGPRLWPGTLVMDLGSTKQTICAAMDRLPPGLQPIGGHPMTGKETAGFQAAEPGLYRGAPWILTPLPRTSPEALDLARELVEAVGARPMVLEAERHDRLVASISHLPFLLASALVHAVADTGAQDPAVWELAAGGFRDTSRVAASDTRMFLDILMTNREAVLDQLERFGQHVAELRTLLANGDEEALQAKLAISQQARARWQGRGSGDQGIG
ncbi:prephenate dehydrogenase [Litorilinea aerophila]|uniref:Prephenate dehydrogenase n=1 Tax=Litorilinea aerophila TaxID=1204385 RepID=A0A540VC62_9CHLR|nr:prephenate dehydrogenase [Litorilinea aerophila]MCC9077921.1 prephenate dehydrogenase [Litorilinea aerophila]